MGTEEYGKTKNSLSLGKLNAGLEDWFLPILDAK